MYRVYIDDNVKLQQFLNLTDIEYLDVFLNRTTTLIANSYDIFGAYNLNTDAGIMIEDVQIRLPRKLLLSFVNSAFFDVNVQEKEVIISFYKDNQHKVCDAIIAHQQIYTADYEKKLELIARKEIFEHPINLSDCRNIITIAKNNKTNIDINSGILATRLSARKIIFNTIAFHECFSVTATHLFKLLQFSSKIYVYANYLIANSGSCIVFITQSRSVDNSSLMCLMQEKAKYRLHINVGNLLSFLSKEKLKLDVLTISPVQGICEVAGEFIKYRVPVTISEKEKCPNSEWENITIPLDILQNVLAYGNSLDITWEKKRNFAKISTDNFYVIY